MQTTLRKQTIPIAIFFFFSGFYLLTAQGIISEADGIINFLTVRALAETQSFVLDIDCDAAQDFVQMRSDGQCYGKYDVGLALTGLPFYLIGRLLDGAAPADYDALSLPRLFVSTLNQFVTAATGAVLYLLALELSGSQQKALELAVLFGLATIAWPYASTYFSQPLVGLLLLTAVLWLRVGGSVVSSLGAGSVLGWAILTRLDALPLVLIILIYAFRQFQTRTTSRRDLLRHIFLLTAPLVFAVIVFLLLNQFRSGSAFQNGYAGEGWTGNFWQGIYGLLFSPGRGIIFYSPLVILAVPGLLSLWRKKWPAETVLIVGLLLVQIATYASWWTWDGGWVWGPRFLVSTQPFLMLGLLPWLDQARYKALFLGLVTLGFFVQIIGVATSPLFYLAHTDFTFTQTLYNPAASPILGQALDLLNRRVVLLIPSQAHGVLSRGQTVVWALVSVGLMVAGGRRLSRVTRR